MTALVEAAAQVRGAGLLRHARRGDDRHPVFPGQLVQFAQHLPAFVGKRTAASVEGQFQRVDHHEFGLRRARQPRFDVSQVAPGAEGAQDGPFLLAHLAIGHVAHDLDSAAVGAHERQARYGQLFLVTAQDQEHIGGSGGAAVAGPGAGICPFGAGVRVWKRRPARDAAGEVHEEQAGAGAWLAGHERELAQGHAARPEPKGGANLDVAEPADFRRGERRGRIDAVGFVDGHGRVWGWRLGGERGALAPCLLIFFCV